MATICFFSIPAHGHVNPTLPLVRELTARGHHVLYYNTEEFREKIEAAGAAFVPIDPFLPPAPKDLSKRVGQDFASLIEMGADTAMNLESAFLAACKSAPPDLIIADSVCIWGKLFARKCGLPCICSTTSLAFNSHTAGRMKQSPLALLRMILGMGRVNKKLADLRSRGFDAPDLLSLIQNDEKTDTIVYTSRLFQPEAETFGNNYAFVGPLVANRYPRNPQKRPLVYISLGTVLHNAPVFYRRCLEALASLDVNAILSVGGAVDIPSLGELPPNIKLFPRVNQLEVLSETDVFLTHCGMNSVSESLLCGVPMVLHPLHGEEEAVAGRAEELGAGVRLGKPTAKNIRRAIEAVLYDPSYRQAAERISEDFSLCGGAKEAADFVEARLYTKHV